MRKLFGFIVIGLLVVSCGETKKVVEDKVEDTVQNLPEGVDIKNLEKGIYANIETTRGTIFLKLWEDKAPLTVANFVGLAEGNFTALGKTFDEPFYDGIIFHRVIPNFMIQVGDPTATGSGGPGYKFFDETSAYDRFDRKGLLAMANAGPNTNGSQIFITHVPTPHLNGLHTIFGEVVVGQDIVDAIQQGDNILHVSIIRKDVKFEPTKVFAEAYEVKAKDAARANVAKSMTPEEYKDYFFGLVKEMEPTAVQTESGLVYVVREKGKGDVPVRGDHVSLHYLGRFLYGGKFDSSYDRDSPLAFDYLVMGLIPGFNEGVGISNEGQKIDLFIPYYLAYGPAGRVPSIPQYADLVFELDILSVTKADK